MLVLDEFMLLVGRLWQQSSRDVQRGHTFSLNKPKKIKHVAAAEGVITIYHMSCTHNGTRQCWCLLH